MQVARRLVLVYVVALINVFSTLLPAWPFRYHLLARGIPVSLILWAQHVTLFMGIAMLLLAFPAAHRHRRATNMLITCAAIAMFGNVLKGLDVEEAIANGILLVALVRSRRELRDLPLRYTVVDLARLALLLVVIAETYRVVGNAVLAWLHLLAKRQPVARSFGAWAEHMLTAKLPLERLWFSESSLLLPLFLVGLFLVVSWTSLVRALESHAERGDPYARFGRASHNSLAYLARRDDVSTYYDPAGRGVITYRVVGRVALQIGAILAPQEHRRAVYAGFVASCRQQHLIPAAVALAEDERPIARASGMRTLAIGTEAVVDLADFAIERLGKKMRWAHRSLSKRGYRCVMLPAADVTPAQHAALDGIDAEWRDLRGGQSHGCCMTLGRFPTPADTGCLVALVTDEAGQAVAYATFLPGGEGMYSLDLTRRRRQAPNAAMEFLVMGALASLRERGAAQASLNFSTLSSLDRSRLGRQLYRMLSKPFQLGSLEAFNAKFQPRWVARYAAFPSWRALPDVAYAILALEGVDRMALNAVVRAIRRPVEHAAVWSAPAPQENGATAL